MVHVIQDLAIYGIYGLVFTGVCWFGTWAVEADPKWWRIGFAVSALLTMLPVFIR